MKKKPETGICDFCGKTDRKAARDDLNGIIWLYPDERWICESCLRRGALRISSKKEIDMTTSESA